MSIIPIISKWHIIFSQGIKVDLLKVEAVKRCHRPTTPTDIKSFLGLPRYYRWFVEICLSVAAPLTKSSKKNLSSRGSILVMHGKVLAYAFRQLKIYEKNYLTHDLELCFKSEMENVNVEKDSANQEGQYDKLSPFQERKRQRLECRCGCLAHIKFQIPNDMWEVCEFNDVHSHPMIEDNLRHFIQSGRKLTSATKNILGSMVEKYILKRWTKNVKHGSGFEEYTKKKETVKSSMAICLNRLMKVSLTVMTLADNDLDWEEIARKYLYQAKIEIIKHQSELYAENYEKDKNKLSGTDPVTGCKDQILDPIKKKNKSSGYERMKSRGEQRKKKGITKDIEI
ncbi:hypothetical protein CQW23_26345 [Capsicum baccatum]|uniref:Protein FAR1-RELATED SEQUENCE n=1 Tax=Capsicum baccatum TaxID=33114 RepID=A0A2G2VNI2_CAPBA|nr:hypothetical protein CQW23_26345 [Capsicum baccatum]